MNRAYGSARRNLNPGGMIHLVATDFSPLWYIWIEPMALRKAGRLFFSIGVDWTKVQPYNMGRAYGSAENKKTIRNSGGMIHFVAPDFNPVC